MARAPRQVVIHPLLFAAFPVLYLWAHNVQESVSLSDVIRPLVLIVGVTAILFAIGWLALDRDVGRAGLALSALVLLFFSYGYVYRALEGVRIGCGAGPHQPGHRGLDRSSGSDTLRPCIPGSQARENAPAGRHAPGHLLHRPGGIRGGPIPPEFFGYDNSPFLDFLRRKGFYVASSSTANYPRTSISLASSLNMGYLTGDPERIAGEASTRPLLQNHAVGSYLKSLGYRYLHLGSWWGPQRPTRTPT